MNTLEDITNAADKAAVTQRNFEKLDPLLDATGGTGANTRFEGGQFQIWDIGDNAWRPVVAENGVLSLGAPIAE